MTPHRSNTPFVKHYSSIDKDDTESVGGLNAALGEAYKACADAPSVIATGFCLSTTAFRHFLVANDVDVLIEQQLSRLDSSNEQLQSVTDTIQSAIRQSPLPKELRSEILQTLDSMDLLGQALCVRCSATDELPLEYSRHSRYPAFLQVRGVKMLENAIRESYAALYSAGALVRRSRGQFPAAEAAMAVAIQRYDLADLSASGTIYGGDPDSGSQHCYYLRSSWSLACTVAQSSSHLLAHAAPGADSQVASHHLSPWSTASECDTFVVHKQSLTQHTPAIIYRRLGSKHRHFVVATSEELSSDLLSIRTTEQQQQNWSLSDETVRRIASIAQRIERHVGRPMDVDWVYHADTDRLCVFDIRLSVAEHKAPHPFQSHAEPLQQVQDMSRGLALSPGFGVGPVRHVHTVEDAAKLRSNEILLADHLHSEWEPYLGQMSAMVLHADADAARAAGLARALRIPAVVGCSDRIFEIADGTLLSVDCSQAPRARVYEAEAAASTTRFHAPRIGQDMQIMLSLPNIDEAMFASLLPNAGVGYVSVDRIIAQKLGVEAEACVPHVPGHRSTTHPIPSGFVHGYSSAEEAWVQKLADEISLLCAAFAPKDVMLCLPEKISPFAQAHSAQDDGYVAARSDDNLRGASGLLSTAASTAGEMLLRALHLVRHERGFENCVLCVPYCRTTQEAQKLLQLFASHGFERGVSQLRIFLLADLPCNAVLASSFSEYFDGVLIDTEELRRLSMGLSDARTDGLPVHSEEYADDSALRSMIAEIVHQAGSHALRVGVMHRGRPYQQADLDFYEVQGVDFIVVEPGAVNALLEEQHRVHAAMQDREVD